MPKIESQYEKDKLPAALAEFAVERDGIMHVEFADSVAIATNQAAGANNVKLKSEKDTLQSKYDALVTSSGELAREVTDLQGKITSGGQVSANELAIITALKGIDKTPKEIKAMIDQLPVLQAELGTLKSQQENAQIAAAMGWKTEVFNDFRNHPDRKDLKFDITDVTEDGKTVKKVYVESKDAQGAIVKKELPEFVKASPVWQGYLPALQSDGTSNGPEWLEQSPAGGSVGPKTSVLQDHINQRNAQAASKGNALVPPPVPPVQTPLAT